MDAREYDAWYDTPRGQWIGTAEFRLLADILRLRPGESLLDIGCGTGWFTRRFARESAADVTGLDPNGDSLRYAVAHRAGSESYVAGDGGRLPFADRSFDCAVAVASLCFAPDEAAFLGEMVRVTRRRCALVLLNRRSLLYLRKGRRGGTGAYRGARWHTARELRSLLARFPLDNVAIASGIFLPGGGWAARTLETLIPKNLPLGAFLAASGDCR